MKNVSLDVSGKWVLAGEVERIIQDCIAICLSAQASQAGQLIGSKYGVAVEYIQLDD